MFFWRKKRRQERAELWSILASIDPDDVEGSEFFKQLSKKVDK